MTTNGLLLPEFADALAEARLHRVGVTVSLDALDPGIFGAMHGRGQPPGRVLEGGYCPARGAGLGVKINMVVQRGVNDGEILPMARHCKREGLVLRFIEFMDVGNSNHWDPAMVVSGREILGAMRAEHRDDEALCRLVAGLWSRRSDRYSELRAEAAATAPKVEMSFIAG